MLEEIGRAYLMEMERHRIETVFSFDRGFDGFPGVTRLGE